MNILSYNIRGCGSSIKHESICKLVFKGKFDICLFQETKIQNHASEANFSFMEWIWGGLDSERFFG